MFLQQQQQQQPKQPKQHRASMSKRKGLSFEEKRSRMLSLFHESTDFFTLKEMEKVASKQKGIVSQSVKEVLDSLTSDNLVQVDKIGTSNYFWSFPSTALLHCQKRQSDLNADIQQTIKQAEELDLKIADAQLGREVSDERTQLLQQLCAAEQELSEMRKELQQYADNDPAALDAKNKCADVAKSAANRWTDHIFTLQSYCSKNFNMDGDTFSSQFSVPAELDSL